MIPKNEAIENVEFIKNLMAQTRSDLVEKNIGQMIVWGVLVTLSCFTVAWLKFNHHDHLELPVWLCCFALAMAYSFYDSRKYVRKVKVLNTVSRIFAGLWTASYIIFLLASVLPFIAVNPMMEKATYCIISLILTINYTTIAVAFREKPIYFSAIVFFLCSVSFYFIPPIFHDLVFGTAMLLGQVVPSLWLKYRS
jgi:hypothetical protein